MSTQTTQTTQTTENIFEALLEESLQNAPLEKGVVIQATIVEVNADHVVLNAGLKSDAVVAKEEFKPEELTVGEQVDVVVESPVNSWGETCLSREKAVRAKIWLLLDKSYQDEEIITGRILERVKGGFTVDVEGLRAFLPGSLIDVKPIRDPSHLMDCDLEFKIIKMDQKRNNIVVSRKAVMEAENSEEVMARLEELETGQEVMGVVKNITDYGAFVDLGGIDGLLHITDMSWKRVKHPSELVNVGDELKVKILRFDREKKRVSLGIKQMGEDPWLSIAGRYPSGTRIKGKVTNVTEYGCFVELEEGVEGLVHMSEMDWTNKNIHPGKLVSPGQEVEVMVLEIDESRRRISLGVKQCQENPWNAFSREHKKGDRIKGTIRSITDFGVFIGLEGSIDGLVHLSDLSWSKSGEEAVHDYNKGDEVEAVILAIDSDRERISLGIKQLESNPVDEFVEGNNDVAVEAKVTKVLAKSASVELADEVVGVMKIAEYSHDHYADLREVLNVGDIIQVKVVGSDTKYGVLVSKKALELNPKDHASSEQSGSAPTNTTLGDLLKEQMGKDD